MTPVLGADVHVLVDPATNNGSDTAPGKITRVWDEEMVSVRIFRDGPACGDDWATVLLYESREAAEAEAVTVPHGAFWPPPVCDRPELVIAGPSLVI